MPNRTTLNATHTHPHPVTTTPHPLISLPSQSSHSSAAGVSCWRLPNFWLRAIDARSKRRRNKYRRRDESTPPTANTNTNRTDEICDRTPALSSSSSASSFSTLKHSRNNNHCNNNIGSETRNIMDHVRSCSAYLEPTLSALSATALSLTKHATCLATLFLALLTLSACAASPCDSNSWWDSVRDKCINCTVCKGEMIPLRPCQLHRDTICGSIYDLKIDWVVLAKTEPNWKERRKTDEHGLNLERHYTHEELQQMHEEVLPLDWQTAALFLAVLACLLFFIVAACILIHHMRQWRRMERRLDQDVEELSTKLMAKLAEVQSLEGGTFFIGNADALRVPTAFQPQHVLLPEKPAKHPERRVIKALQPGNVYIEESSSKG